LPPHQSIRPTAIVEAIVEAGLISAIFRFMIMFDNKSAEGS
jgi:hypothetical protein